MKVLEKFREIDFTEKILLGFLQLIFENRILFLLPIYNYLKWSFFQPFSN